MIYRQTHQANYTVYSNTLIDSKLPSDCKNVLLYLLSKPTNWKLIKSAIAKALGISKYAVQQAVMTLRKLGYLCFYRHKDGSGHWDVFETPRSQCQAQTPVVKPSSELPTLAFQTDLTNTESQKIIKQLHDEPIPNPGDPITPIVVAENLIEQPTIIATDPVIIEQIERLPIEPKEKKIAEKTLSNLSLDEVKAILNIFASALTLKNIQNPIGYLVGLKKAALNGTLTVNTARKELTLSERLAKEKKQREEEAKRGAMTNPEWAEWFKQRTGIKPF